MTVALQFDRASLLHANARGLTEATASLSAGRVVALVGPSGAGKSSLLRLAAGLAAPTSGRVEVLGTRAAELKGAAYRALRAQIGVLHQSDNLTQNLPVAHNVLMGHLGRWSSARALWSRFRPRHADLAQARAALAAVELEDRLWASPKELSGGEQQRVALARLALQRPRLWLADEPTAGLDVRLRSTMLELLLGHVRASEGTAIIALHDLALLGPGFDEVWAVRDGTLQALGDPRAASGALDEVFATAEESA